MEPFTLNNHSQSWEFSKKVLPQHADHAGVMWHGSYVSWLEESRVEILSELGVNYHELSAIGIEIPVISLEINYKNPLKLGDKVLLKNWFLGLKGLRWVWKTNFFKSGSILSAEAKVELVPVIKNDCQFKIMRKLPDQLVEALKQMRLDQKY